MWGRTIIESGICEIHVRLSMNNDTMETAVGYMWVDIWCMLDWIIGLFQKRADVFL